MSYPCFYQRSKRGCHSILWSIQICFFKSWKRRRKGFEISSYILILGARVQFNNLGDHSKLKWSIIEAKSLACFENDSTQDLLEALQQLHQSVNPSRLWMVWRSLLCKPFALRSSQGGRLILIECIVKHYFITGLVTSVICICDLNGPIQISKHVVQTLQSGGGSSTSRL